MLKVQEVKETIITQSWVRATHYDSYMTGVTRKYYENSQ